MCAMTTAATMMVRDVDRPPQKDVRWFGPWACVERDEDGRCRVFVGGRLIGEFGPQDRRSRNTLLLGLSLERSFRKGKLADAFGMTDEHLRRIRRWYEAHGEAGIPSRGPGGSKPKADEKTREKLFRRFEEGMDAAQAKKAEPRIKLSYATIHRMRRAWEMSRASVVAAIEPVATPVQTTLFELVEAEPEEPDRSEEGAAGPVRAGRDVRHLGTWILLSLLERGGLYDDARSDCTEKCDWSTLRVVLDAVIAALALGQRCVEGVRRLEAPSAGVLLRSLGAPSESWVRRVAKRFGGGTGGARARCSMRVTSAFTIRWRRCSTSSGPRWSTITRPSSMCACRWSSLRSTPRSTSSAPSTS